jgi:hypothetical protein
VGDGLVVELVQPVQRGVSAGPATTTHQAGPEAGLGIFKAGVLVDDVAATVARLRARGVVIAFGPYPKRPDQPANAIIRDDAGNLIQILGR